MKTVISIFVVSLILFTVGIQSQEVIGFDSRFYLFAQEMLRNGLSWFPTTYNQPYPDYPATGTIIIYFFAHAVGGLSKWVAVLPTAIIGALTVVITYLIGRLRSKELGLYAVFLLILTIGFFKASRAISLDMYPTLITALCFYLIYSADLKNKPTRVWWLFPLFFAGFLFRGPIGLVVPAGVVSIYYLIDRRFKTFFIIGVCAFILLILSIALLLAAAFHTGGESFMQAVIRMEMLGRMGASKLPWFFYFKDSVGSYALTYPLAILTMVGVGYVSLKEKTLIDKSLLLKLTGWVLIILVGLSIPGDKKVRYVLPMVPALALLAAYPLAEMHGQLYFSRLRSIMLMLFRYFPALLFILVEVIYFETYQCHYAFAIPYVFLLALFFILQIASMWFYNRPFFILAIAAFSFAIAEIKVLEPIENYLEKAHDFVVAVENERTNAHATLVFYKEHPDSMPIKYLINMPQWQKPIFIDQPEKLVRFNQPAFFVTSSEYFMHIPKNVLTTLKIVATEKMAHVNVVVFTKIK